MLFLRDLHPNQHGIYIMNMYVIFVLLVILVIRVALNFIDKENIYKAAVKKGWRNISISWAPFAPGAIFEQSERSYKVVYMDAENTPNFLYCKTSMLTGVFWKN
jgi:hypothetical protein